MKTPQDGHGGERDADAESVGSRVNVRRVEVTEVFDGFGAPREEVRRRQDHFGNSHMYSRNTHTIYIFLTGETELLMPKSSIE